MPVQSQSSRKERRRRKLSQAIRIRAFAAEKALSSRPRPLLHTAPHAAKQQRQHPRSSFFAGTSDAAAPTPCPVSRRRARTPGALSCPSPHMVRQKVSDRPAVDPYTIFMSQKSAKSKSPRSPKKPVRGSLSAHRSPRARKAMVSAQNGFYRAADATARDAEAEVEDAAGFFDVSIAVNQSDTDGAGRRSRARGAASSSLE